MVQALRLGVAGLGTVGGGLLRLLEAHATRLAETVGRPVVVAGPNGAIWLVSGTRPAARADGRYG